MFSLESLDNHFWAGKDGFKVFLCNLVYNFILAPVQGFTAGLGQRVRVGVGYGLLQFLVVV